MVNHAPVATQPEYICSARIVNLRDFEIALRNLKISKLRTDFEIVLRFLNCHPISKLRCAISKSRNFNTHAHFQNCARACIVKSPSSSMDQCDQKQFFDRFCVEQFKDRDDKTSKTISREKGQRIVNVIKKDPSAVTYSSQFKFWVKKNALN